MIDVKICGITRREDALAAADLGAWAVGFVFWPGSPRYIDPRAARAIVHALPPSMITVGVFVNQPAGHVRLVAEEAGITTIQLHGEEPLTLARSLDRPVLKAVVVRDGFAPESLDSIPAEITVLLDAFDPVAHGGTGRTIDWTAAAAAAARRPVVLAGGLTAANIAAAIRTVRPRAVDLSSGVESAPGIKDPAKLRDLFAALPHD
jgi:phosphoribosylanthranilate isomerase